MWQVLSLLGIGLASGMLGGMLGIGGGVVTIPMLTLLLGHHIHIAQAASMVTTPFVATASALGHHRERAVCIPLVKRVAPVACLAIMVGVTASIWTSNTWLQVIFGVFLLYVAVSHWRKLVAPKGAAAVSEPRITMGRAATVGVTFGLGAGLLGIGGGLIMVPMLGYACGLSLRHAIATSSAVMVFSSIIGAIFKNGTLGLTPDLPADFHWWIPLEIAAWLIPSCLLSSWTGARLSHRMPLKVIRTIFIVLVLVAAGKMLYSSGGEALSGLQGATAAATSTTTGR